MEWNWSTVREAEQVSRDFYMEDSRMSDGEHFSVKDVWEIERIWTEFCSMSEASDNPSLEADARLAMKILSDAFEECCPNEASHRQFNPHLDPKRIAVLLVAVRHRLTDFLRNKMQLRTADELARDRRKLGDNVPY